MASTTSTARKSDSSDRGGVQVIRRASQILQALAERPEGMSLSEVASRTSLARSTVHRIISALESERLVVASLANGGYRLGPAVISLAVASARSAALDLHPFMAQLSRELNETVDLAVRDYDHARFVHQIAVPRRLQAVSTVGAIFPVHCTANGKALLVDMPVDHVMRLLSPELERYTANTITSRDALLDELEQIRVSGLAFDREEHTLGICAVGVPVPDPGGHPMALTVALPASRFYGHEERLSSALLATRDAITEQFGTGQR